MPVGSVPIKGVYCVCLFFALYNEGNSNYCKFVKVHTNHNPQHKAASVRSQHVYKSETGWEKGSPGTTISIDWEGVGWCPGDQRLVFNSCYQVHPLFAIHSNSSWFTTTWESLTKAKASHWSLTPSQADNRWIYTTKTATGERSKVGCQSGKSNLELSASTFQLLRVHMQQQEVPFLQGEFCLGWTWPPETQATKTPEMKQNFKKPKQLNNCKKSNLNWQKGWGGKKGKYREF